MLATSTASAAALKVRGAVVVAASVAASSLATLYLSFESQLRNVIDVATTFAKQTLATVVFSKQKLTDAVFSKSVNKDGEF
jgi:hypothetical protein